MKNCVTKRGHSLQAQIVVVSTSSKHRHCDTLNEAIIP